MEDKLEQRLYFFVPYNISEIQKGIQAGHAALEYVESWGNSPEYRDFIRHYRTWIILNGGTTLDYHNTKSAIGSLNEIEQSLYSNQIRYSVVTY